MSKYMLIMRSAQEAVDAYNELDFAEVIEANLLLGRRTYQAFARDWPREDRMLTTEERTDLQTRLAALGHPAGATGTLPAGTSGPGAESASASAPPS